MCDHIQYRLCFRRLVTYLRHVHLNRTNALALVLFLALLALRAILFLSPATRGRAAFAGRRFFILSHELTATGAPRVCAELAFILGSAGAQVVLAVDAKALPVEKSVSPDGMARRFLSRLVPSKAPFEVNVGASIETAAGADVVVVSTAAPQQVEWIRQFRLAAPAHGRLVWWIHEGAAVMSQWPKEHTARIVDTMADGYADVVVFPSISSEEWWRKALSTRKRKILIAFTRVLPWGIPRWREHALAGSAAMRVPYVRASLDIPRDAFVFLVVASYNPIKGHRGVLAAFKAAQSKCDGGSGLHIIFVGVGLGQMPWFFPQSDVAWVWSDPSIHLLNETDAVADYFAAADAYVSNTLGAGEAWGLATLEALAAGVPTLASRVGGAAEMLQDGVTALLHDVSHEADNSEAPALAAHMCSLVSDVALRTTLGARGRAWARKHFGHAYLETSIEHLIHDTLALPGRLRNSGGT